jgi:hypothetical protein
MEIGNEMKKRKRKISGEKYGQKHKGHRKRKEEDKKKETKVEKHTGRKREKAKVDRNKKQR